MNGTKDTGRKVFRVILADTLILTGITVFMQWVLSIMGLSLRKWFLVMLAILITAGFICGKTVRIMEDYGKGGFDPLRKDRITNIMR